MPSLVTAQTRDGLNLSLPASLKHLIIPRATEFYAGLSRYAQSSAICPHVTCLVRLGLPHVSGASRIAVEVQLALPIMGSVPLSERVPNHAPYRPSVLSDQLQPLPGSLLRKIDSAEEKPGRPDG